MARHLPALTGLSDLLGSGSGGSPAEEQVTTLRDIMINIGRTGAATPFAVLDPVFVGDRLLAYRVKAP